MREIKFRAWDGLYSKMNTNQETPLVGNLLNSICGQDDPLVDSEKTRYTLMQYTGLKDINGVEIYEGDILKSDINETFGVVSFQDGKFVVTWEDVSEDLFEWTSEFIIGNIYEDGELLK